MLSSDRLGLYFHFFNLGHGRKLLLLSFGNSMGKPMSLNQNPF